VIYTALVMIPSSPVLSFDERLANLELWTNYPSWRSFVHYYVIFGQRGPATLVFLPFFLWVSWRSRSTRPLVMLGASLVLLNVSVGILKFGLGRVGPAHANDVHNFFDGGTIYPSGHVSNVVVLYGLIAWISPRFRKTLIAIAVFLSATVGFGTVFLRTHWFSDVVGGWIAGALVLLALPTMMPTAQRWADAGFGWLGARIRGRHRNTRTSTRAAVNEPSQLAPEAPARPNAPKHARQGKDTPVRSAARSQSFAATRASFDERDDPTRRGDPRNSPIPSGP
jgi:membrane-associated phospholipid phosphatase